MPLTTDDCIAQDLCVLFHPDLVILFWLLSDPVRRQKAMIKSTLHATCSRDSAQALGLQLTLEQFKGLTDFKVEVFTKRAHPHGNGNDLSKAPGI